MANVLHAAEKDEFASRGRQMGKWIDQVLGPGFRHPPQADGWKPAINVCEYKTYYCLIVDLAGVKASEVDLRAENGAIVLSGNRPMPAPPEASKDVRVCLMEIDHGRFHRVMDLPEDVDIDAIEAYYRNGYLWVRLPKTS
jgi:HSP20 family molecular chaperone IbpA